MKEALERTEYTTYLTISISASISFILLMLLIAAIFVITVLIIIMKKRSQYIRYVKTYNTEVPKPGRTDIITTSTRRDPRRISKRFSTQETTSLRDSINLRERLHLLSGATQ